MTSVRLPENLEHRLEMLAAATRRSKGFYIKEALERYLEEMEDAYLALDRIAQPARVFHTSKDVLRDLKTPTSKRSSRA